MLRLILWVWVTALLAGCAQSTAVSTPTPTANPPQLLRIGLTTSAVAHAEAITNAYTAVTNQAILQFVPGNTAVLQNALAAGELDAILVHALPDAYSHWFNPVALDGLALLVHPTNPLANLTRTEAQAIFNGRITNWAELGGPDQPIQVIIREPGSGARTLFTSQIMAAQRPTINAQIAASHSEMLTAIANSETAVGFAMMGGIPTTDPVKMLTVDGIAAIPAQTTSQNYPLTAPLYIATGSPQEPQGELRAFIAWLQSDGGQAVLGNWYGRIR